MGPVAGIRMIGCRENNLKNVDVCIPYSKIVSFIGVSGSGKSSLVFDTLFAEGKRRYIESLGINESYFINKQGRPDARLGKRRQHNAKAGRSTAGTISQAAYYIQLLFARCGDSRNRNEQLAPSMFNLNSPAGVCSECGGEGSIVEFDETRIWPNQDLSISENGILLGVGKPGTTKYNFMLSFIKQFGCEATTPIRCYSNELKVALLYGQKKTKQFRVAYPGIIPSYEQTYRTTKSVKTREEIEKYMRRSVCNCCKGTGYRPESLDVTIAGKNIADVMHMDIDTLNEFLHGLIFQGEQQAFFQQIAPNLFKIIDGCRELGIGYLSFDRKASSLSGGEFQRLHLVSQISSQISGVVYVLDEPSAGMHASDIEKLLSAIRKLNQSGNQNTIIMVEHTRELINASDYLFELGPGAGAFGGQVIAEGTPNQLWENPSSLSGPYLAGRRTSGQPNRSDFCEYDKSLRIIGACSHNLKSVDVEIPLNKFVCFTGVSGSGKTSLLFDSFLQSIQNKRATNLKLIEGMEGIRKVIVCDQSPIGVSTRSCPVTYLNFYQNIREKFANTQMAKKRKWTEKYFSFNLEAGHCPRCNGVGRLEVDMAFLPSESVVCDLCGGQRFRKEILEIQYRGKSISDVLNMDITEALSFFEDDAVIVRKLQSLIQVGLDYLTLGQSTNTLSGGETQRLKLAAEMSKPRFRDTLFIFDEPSRGLHFEDVKKLIELFKAIVSEQNTVLIIEHNLDIISTADYVIDLGPYAGNWGGEVCGTGTPYQISLESTPTGTALAKFFSTLNPDGR